MSTRDRLAATGHAVFSAPQGLNPFDLLGNDLAWVTDEALCSQADPEAWFGDGQGHLPPGKALCADCPLRMPCAAYALAHPEVTGVWGGTNDKERKRLRGQASRAKLAACGTDSGYYRHLRTLGEPACPACLAAHADAQRRRAERAS